MIEKTTGLILRTRPLTETSLIIEWLTSTLGRIDTVAKGARRPKSVFRGQLDLFYRSDLSFERSRRSELHILREVRLRETYSPLREDWRRLEQAAYAAQLIQQVTERETPLPGIFELMSDFLGRLTSGPPQPRTVFAFELRLLDLVGLKPDLERTSLRPHTKHLICALMEESWQDVSILDPDRPAAEELARFLHGFLLYHLGSIPKTRHAALLRAKKLVPPKDGVLSVRP